MGRHELDMTNRRNLLHKEPGVIDQEMIIEALSKVLPKGNVGKYAREAGIDPMKAQALSIEFQSISQISNLSQMINLKKLALSNNVIDKIDKLDELVNLEELDLSFNAIKKLEGLDQLRKLKVLNVHRNLISVVENLKNNLCLEVFVCSTNGIKTLENVVHLRRLVRLRALNLEGNPMCDDMEYRSSVIALLPELIILDYVRIKPSEKVLSEQTQFHSRIQAMVGMEDGLRRRASVVAANEELQEVYKTAFADGLEGEEFWTSLYQNDSNGQKILQIPSVAPLRENYQELLSAAAQDLFIRSMRAYTIRQNEQKAFDLALRGSKKDVIFHGRLLTEEFLLFSKKMMQKIRPIMAQLELTDKVNGGTDYKGQVPADYAQLQDHLTTFVLAYVKKLHQLWFCLMTAEVELNEQIMDVGQELARTLRHLINAWLEQLHVHFHRIRDIDFKFYEELFEFLVSHEEDQTEDFDEDLEYVDGESVPETHDLAALVEASHDHHNMKIFGKEEVVTARLKSWLEKALSAIQIDEVDRFRRRVSEISHFVDFHYGILKELNILEHCIGYIPPLRADPNHIPTKQEIKDKKAARKEHEHRKDLKKKQQNELIKK